MMFISLDQLTVMELIGKDAAKITNNLCTADILKLAEGCGREAFVTDVKGKALGHVCIYRTADGVRLIGAPGNDASVLASHFDRYTIREDAVPQLDHPAFHYFVLDQPAVAALGFAPSGAHEVLDLPFQARMLDGIPVTVYGIPWWREAAGLVIAPADSRLALQTSFLGLGLEEGTTAEFHRRRIDNGYPWYGVDFDATNLPQEADRDELAISFRKGCYLGQETIARLDSLGQVQKKLVRWSIESAHAPQIGAELRAGDRVVGRLTSVVLAGSPAHYLGLGFARRTHFDAGSQATGIHADGSSFQAVVSERG